MAGIQRSRDANGSGGAWYRSADSHRYLSGVSHPRNRGGCQLFFLSLFSALVVTAALAGVALLLVRAAQKFRLKNPGPRAVWWGRFLLWFGCLTGLNFLILTIYLANRASSVLIGYALGTAILYPALGWFARYMLGGTAAATKREATSETHEISSNIGVGKKNWQLGLIWLWFVISGIWIAFVVISVGPYLFAFVRFEDFIPRYLPAWTSLTTYVDAYADHTFPAYQHPSNALFAARIGDMVIAAILPPLVILLVALAMRWVAAGFNQQKG